MSEAEVSEAAQDYFNRNIASTLEAPKCLECHSSGGSAGYTRLQLLAGGSNKNTHNANEFYELMTLFNSEYILNKIKGRNHGGGLQYSESSYQYQNFITFFDLLQKQDLDGDQDGVTDDEDECPNTLSGIEVSDNGCPQATVSIGEAWSIIPGSTCRPSEPARSIAMQSRETGLTNTGDINLTAICPISLELSNESSDNIIDWTITVKVANEGSLERTIQCNAYQRAGLVEDSSTTKEISLEPGSSSGIVWEMSRTWTNSTFTISCLLPPSGVIRSVSLNVQ